MQVICNGEEVLTVSGTKEKYVVDVWSGNHPFFKVCPFQLYHLMSQTPVWLMCACSRLAPAQMHSCFTTPSTSPQCCAYAPAALARIEAVSACGKTWQSTLGRHHATLMWLGLAQSLLLLLQWVLTCRPAGEGNIKSF